MTPSSVPGSVSGWPAPPVVGEIVVTYCLACNAVEDSKAPAWKLRKMSTTTAPTSSTPTIAPTMSLARFNAVEFPGSDISSTSFGERRHRQTAFPAQFQTSMHAGEYHRHKK